jgi:prevent-host-death family protein
MMQQVKLDEATTRLADLIEAAVRGEVIYISKNAAQTVRLVPVVHASAARRPGSAIGFLTIADDFEAPLDDFREYME